MKQDVHILVTLRNPALLGTALLVFRTLRKGFPSAAVTVWGNALGADALAAVMNCAHSAGATVTNIAATTHGKWIEGLVLHKTDPFWICDTDVVFVDRIQQPESSSRNLFAGRLEPEFAEEWTGTRHMERLHPSLMWFNPEPLRLALRGWPAVDPFFNTVRRELFEWSFVPKRKRMEDGRWEMETQFYDTCAGLHHALGGTPFTEEQNAAYEHLHAGTYSDLIGRCAGLKDLPAVHRSICTHPDTAKGLQTVQSEYYKTRRII